MSIATLIYDVLKATMKRIYCWSLEEKNIIKYNDWPYITDIDTVQRELIKYKLRLSPIYTNTLLILDLKPTHNVKHNKTNTYEKWSWNFCYKTYTGGYQNI